jgi:hypothetical protein
METFAKLFGSLLSFVYYCFDRLVILGHLPLLTRPENLVYFFRDVYHSGAITKEVLRKRTNEYHRWVQAFARKRQIPSNGQKRACAKRITSTLTCSAWSGRIASVFISF